MAGGARCAGAVAVVVAFGFAFLPGPQQVLEPATPPLMEEGEDFPIPDPFALGRVVRHRDGPKVEDVRVNQAAVPGDYTSCHVQSETSVIGRGKKVWVAFNDGRDCFDVFTGSFTGLAYSEDGGKTFKDLGPLPPNGDVSFIGGDPVLVMDTRGNANGTVYLASLASDSSGASSLAVGVVKDEEVRWNLVNTGAATAFHDKEWLAIDNSGGRHDGNLYLTWTAFGDPGGILFTRSTDGGTSWSEPIVLDDTAVQGSRPVVGPDGEVHVVWQRFDEGIYHARSDDGGVTFSPATKVAPTTSTGHASVCIGPRDVLNGEIRTHEFPAVAVDSFGRDRKSNPHRGRLYVTYTDDGEGLDEADVKFTTLGPTSTSWSKPVKVNDDGTATDQFFPEVVATGPGRFLLSWTDKREDEVLPSPAGNRSMRQYLATGKAGQIIGENQPASDVLFPPPFSNPNTGVMISPCYAGDYNALYFDGRDVLAAWGDNRDDLFIEAAPVPAVPDPNVYFTRIRP